MGVEVFEGGSITVATDTEASHEGGVEPPVVLIPALQVQVRLRGFPSAEKVFIVLGSLKCQEIIIVQKRA